MSHEIDQSKGIAAFAFAGPREDVWHGLGQQIEPGDDIPAITKKAGLDWSAKKSAVKFAVELADGTTGDRTFDNQSVLYRTDTGNELGIVSDNKYNIVQPDEIMGFFKEFLAGNGLDITTAGAVRKGRIIYCMASLGDKFRVKVPGSNDRIDTFVRLQTSYDGSRATDLVGTTTRQVCANTMRLVDVDSDRKGYRVKHSAVFDDATKDALKKAFGLLGEQHKMTSKLWNALCETAVTDEQAALFFCQVLNIDPKDLGKTKIVTKKGKQETVDVVHTRTANTLKELAAAFKSGPGAGLKSANGTAFGLLNAVTYWIDHKSQSRDTEGEGKVIARLASSQFGNGDVIKQQAQKLAAKLAGAEEFLKVTGE